MNFCKKAYHFYLDASIHVALALYCLTQVFSITLGFSYTEPLSYTIFFGSIAGYNFIKYATIAKNYYVLENNYLKKIQLLSAISFIAAWYYAIQMPVKMHLALLVVALLFGLYAIPFGKKNKNLRNYSGIKIYLVAFSWAYTSVILPIINTNHSLSYSVLALFIQAFLLVLCWIFCFEIRDLKTDPLTLKTIPQTIGITKTKKLGYLLLGITLGIELFIKQEYAFSRMIFYSILIASFLGLYFSKENSTKSYCAFWVEAIAVFWFLLLKMS